MKIGVYSPRVGFATSGGTETVVRELIKQLANRHDITLYTGRGELIDEVKRMDVDVCQVPLTKQEDVWNRTVSSFTPVLPAEIESVTMFRNARRTGVLEMMSDKDVVTTHYYLDNLLLSRSINVPNVFHIPGIKHPSVRWRAMARVANPDSYLATSQSTKRRAEEWLGIDVDGIVYPGVDVEQFSPDVSPALDADAPVIMFVGRLTEGKGIPDLVDAHARLESTASLYLIGDGPLAASLEDRAREHGTAESVVFTGAIDHDEIHKYFAACDIFCLPSYHEGFPVVNLEALASGKPIVSTRIESIEEQVDNETNGLLVEPGNIDELQAALDELLSNPERQLTFGEESRTRSMQFTWERQAKRLEDHCARISNLGDHPDA